VGCAPPPGFKSQLRHKFAFVGKWKIRGAVLPRLGFYRLLIARLTLHQYLAKVNKQEYFTVLVLHDLKAFPCFFLVTYLSFAFCLLSRLDSGVFLR